MRCLRTLMLHLLNHPVFRSRLQVLKGKAGIVTEELPCGCLLKGEHIPEKHLWLFTVDYSKCKNHKD